MPRKKQLPKFKYTTRKKDKNGVSVLYVKYPIDGVKYPIWKKPEHETQESVNETIEQIKIERAAIWFFAQTPNHCGEFFDYWLNLIKSHVSLRTYDDRSTVIKNHLKPELGGWEVRQVTTAMLKVFFANLVTVKKLAPNTVKKIYSVAKLIFEEALHLEMIPYNPVERVKRPKSKALEKVKYMTIEEARKFLDCSEGSEYGTLFEFALETGMRPQEYLALRWTDINFSKQTAEITRAVVFHKRGGGFYYKETKTRSSRRTITLSEQLCEKLKLHQAVQHEYIREIKDRLKKRYKPSLEFRREYNRQILQNHTEQNLVFASKDFTPITDINLNVRYFKSLAKTAGLSSELTLYSLRHTCATILLSENVNPKVVSERLGHASISITLDTYSHVLPTMQADATLKISDVLNRKKGND